MYFENLWSKFSRLPEVEAIALGGSRAGTQYDEKSDYDLYIYCRSVPKEEIRKQILEECCQYMEIGNAFWELEADCTLKNGIDVDILYRNLSDFSKDIKSVVKNNLAHNGYTTCMWHNLLNSKILYDKEGKFKELQAEFSVEYPEELRKNIIENNMKLLAGKLPSYDMQIKKAVNRNDLLSMNHRVAAFMESYFDIIFAMNKMTHPGEKRMMSIALKNAKILPAHFEQNIEKLFGDLFTNKELVIKDIECMVEELKKVIV